MLQKYFYICNYLLIILVGLYFYKKYNTNKQLVLFLVFLCYSLLTEILGTYLAHELRINAAYIYNTWNIASFLFFLLFFLNNIKNIFKRYLIKSLLFLYIVFFLINLIFYQNYMSSIFIYNIALGNIFVVIIVMLYFGELLKSDLILDMNRSLFFWISIGILIYNIGCIPIFVIGEYIQFSGVYRYVTFLLNILMATSFIIGFIVSKKKYNN